MKLRRVFSVFLPLLIIAVMAGLCFGSAPLSLSELTAAILGRGEVSHGIILWQVRMPRVAAGVLAGIGLSTAGALLQSVTANELAGPNIIGINSGAGLAVILLLSAAPTAGGVLPLAAFLGAFGAAAVILLVAGKLGSSKVNTVLIGIAVTTLLNAVISFLSLLDEGILAQYNHFTVGSLKGIRMADLALPAVIIFGAFAGAMAMSARLGVLSLGDAAASALGIRVKRLRIGAMICAAGCAAAVVSFAGLLGFVGLVVPHMAKRLVGQQPAKVLPVSALVGAILVVLADLLGRTLFAPSELPVGILMSLIGAPYFLILLCRRKKHVGI